jgi:protein TonB
MAYVRQSNSRRAMIFIGSVLFQGLLLYGLANGLVSKVAHLITGPMKTDIIEEQKVMRTAPPPPKPDFKALPPPTVVTPDFAIEAPPTPSSSAISENANKRAAPPAPVITVPPRSNPRRPVTQPEYPPTSKRLGEAGTVILLLTVDEGGKVVDAEIKKSSGFDRLDEAAKDEALRNWHLLPGTVGGKPTKMQYPFAVTFKITD